MIYQNYIQVVEVQEKLSFKKLLYAINKSYY